MTERYFSYFSTKTFAVGTQKNRLIEKLSVRKYLQFYAENFCIFKPMGLQKVVIILSKSTEGITFYLLFYRSGLQTLSNLICNETKI